MNILELSKRQKEELKQRLYCEKNENASYGELANINELVSDKELFEEYGHIDFVEDDFFTKEEYVYILSQLMINDYGGDEETVVVGVYRSEDSAVKAKEEAIKEHIEDFGFVRGLEEDKDHDTVFWNYQKNYSHCIMWYIEKKVVED